MSAIGMTDPINRHLRDLLHRRPELSVCQADVIRAFEMMRDCFRRGGKMLLCGNGGSAADAEHWAGELLKGFVHQRPLDRKEKQRLPPALGRKLQGALPAIALTGLSHWAPPLPTMWTLSWSSPNSFGRWAVPATCWSA